MINISDVVSLLIGLYMLKLIDFEREWGQAQINHLYAILLQNCTLVLLGYISFQKACQLKEPAEKREMKIALAQVKDVERTSSRMALQMGYEFVAGDLT